MKAQPTPSQRKSRRLDSTAGKLPDTGYVRESQLIPSILPFSSATLWRKVKAGSFPAPRKLSERITAWRVEDVRAYMADPTGYRAKEST